MKRLMVPTDFSPTSEAAVLFAHELATRVGGSVVLYHTYTPVESAFIEKAANREQYNLQMESNLAKKLERMKKKLIPEEAGIPVSTVVGHSPLIDNILGFAEDNHIDLIVMGTQGAGGLLKNIIGSHASRVIKEADIPVLLIPEQYEWKEPSHILFISDYAESNGEAIQFILPIARAFSARLSIMHFINLYLNSDQKELEKVRFDAYMEQMRGSLGDEDVRFELQRTHSLTDSFENLHETYPYDLLVMVRRKKRFFQNFFTPNFTRHMAFVTKKPLLVIPQADVE